MIDPKMDMPLMMQALAMLLSTTPVDPCDRETIRIFLLRRAGEILEEIKRGRENT